MSDHYVRHLLQGGNGVKTEFECRATEGGACRTICTLCYAEVRDRCECSHLDKDGEWKLIGDSRKPVMGDLGACGWLPFLEEVPEECYNGPEDEPVRGPDWQPINILFETHDEVSWEYAK